MPEYLAPGVYVEETSFRPKTIEGVSTSTAGFVGTARFGPTDGEPELLTSFLDFERYYGGLEQLQFGDEPPRHNFGAHGVRAFFEEGGRRLYFARIYEPEEDTKEDDPIPAGHAAYTQQSKYSIVARFPGTGGNMRVRITPVVSENVLALDPGTKKPVLRRVQEFDTVIWYRKGNRPTKDEDVEFYDVVRTDEDEFVLEGERYPVEVDNLDPRKEAIFLVTLNVSIERPTYRLIRPQERYLPPEVLEGFKPHPKSPNALTSYFKMNHSSRRLHLSVPFAIRGSVAESVENEWENETGARMLDTLLGEDALGALQEYLDETIQNYVRTSGSPPEERPVRPEQLQVVWRLEKGSDGNAPQPDTYRGTVTGGGPTGLTALEAIEDISIVAAPGYSYGYNDDEDVQPRIETIQAHLINHAERMKYRIAVLDSPDDQLLSEVREYRGKIDSKYAALYYPWVTVFDPITAREVHLPPSGFVSGIYARNDVDFGVQKAPANEVVRLAVGFESMLNKAQQDVLNPIGVNCFRFFEGRGHRLWGARTATSDGEWKYVNLRRYFAYLERSIDVGTQIFVFDSNGEVLWDNVRRTIEAFLFNEWKSARLMGVTTDEAYFVRCDRSTMTQNDLDNGRLICLIGVAPLRPAEFVIFRIGQKLLEAAA